MEIKNKKGEVSTATIVTIIIVIASFAIVLYFWYTLNFGNNANQQACHNSIVLTALTKNVIGRPNCKTQFVCISGGGTCSGNPTETIKVDVKNKNEVLKAIANKMANCWSTFGEGNIDYVSPERFKISNSECALCYDIKFDSKLQEAFPNGITYQETYDYMAKTNMPETQQTYLNYMYGVDDLQTLLKDYPTAQDFTPLTILLNDEYVVLTGEVRKDWLAFWVNGGFIHPVFMDIDDVSKLNCGGYLTKIA